MRMIKIVIISAALLGLAGLGCSPTTEGGLGTGCETSSDCGSGHCVDGVCCESTCSDTCYGCNDQGACEALPSGVEDLDASALCSGSNVCDGSGNCIDDSILNPCTENDECDSGFCVDNACCESACNIQCMSCGNAEGTCSSYVPAGEQDLNSTPTCVSPNACDGAGRCLLGNGESCQNSSECATGFCVDGICCESACDEPCMLCAGEDGTCTYHVAAGEEDQNSVPPCVGDSACDANGVCLADMGGACTTAQDCVSGFCVDGVCCENACDTPCHQCNAFGFCNEFVPDGDPDPNSNPPCENTHHCDGAGTCEEIGLPPGQACTVDTECESGHCEDNTCCMTACAVPCLSCANAQGTCTTFVPAFTEDPGNCEAPSVCDGAGTCCENQSQVAQQLPVDIIFVIDNSGSMGQEIQAVENNINVNFASIIAASGLDYRVIMLAEHGPWNPAESICVEAPLSGIPAGGCASPPAQPVNNPPIFYHYSYPVLSHDSFCKILDRFDKPDQYSQAPNGYSQWLRPNAFKVFIEITDDGVSCSWSGNTFSDGNSVAGGNVAGPAFDTALLALSPSQFGTAAARKYIWYSIIALENRVSGNPTVPWLPADPITTGECPTAADPGTGYQALSKLTGGLRFPLCEPSYYDVVFNAIASNVVSSMACQYVIPANVNPAAASLQFTPSVGPPELWTMAADLASCVGDQWYLDDPSNPSLILLCPDACTRAQNDVGSQVEFLACVLD